VNTYRVRYFKTPKGAVTHIHLTHIHPRLAYHFWRYGCQGHNPNDCWDKYSDTVVVAAATLPMCRYCEWVMEWLDNLQEWAAGIVAERMLGRLVHEDVGLSKGILEAVESGISLAEAKLVPWTMPD